ncbi:hypothetical protein AXG93_3040s1070 [Marchantia polymorpha subsp. ruderalis]|uniref:Uncharacterized protein n=1 Tax=Marchantia polymorpha subsp. ruderalis TaxID=1480154 RepID=A0A176VZQ4_MARPO|nr:hypothetical protein AXG93_3040s1070 [Marchantia polymorpha subsp. ruderalis]
MIKMVSHRQRLYKLIDSMGVTCPLLKDTRWEFMHGVSDFIDNRRHEIISHYAELSQNAPASAFDPSISWWIINSAVSSLTLTVKNLTRSMQGKATLLSLQDESIERVRSELLVELQIDYDVIHPESVDDHDKDDILQHGLFSVSRKKVVKHIEGLNFWCIQNFPLLDEANKSNVVNCVGQLLMEVVEGLSQIVSLRDDNNDASDQAIPPALPQDYAKLSSHKMLVNEAKQELVAKVLKECQEGHFSFTNA